MKTHKPMYNITSHRGIVWSVDINPTYNLVASGGLDSAIHIHDLETGTLLQVY